MVFSLVCSQCGQPMTGRPEGDAAHPAAVVWRCAACGIETVQPASLMSEAQLRERLRGSISAAAGEVRSRLLPLRLAMAAMASVAMGILGWLLTRSMITAALAAGIVAACTLGLGLIERCYLHPRRMDRWVERMVRQASAGMPRPGE